MEDWLSGLSRQVIARNYEISTGAVSLIVNEFEENYGSIYFARSVSKYLYKKGFNFLELEKAIRLQHKIDSYNFSPANVQTLLEHLIEYCFNKHYEPNYFFKHLSKVLENIDNMSIPLVDYEFTINRLSHRIRNLEHLIASNREILNGLESKVKDYEDIKQLQPIHLLYMKEKEYSKKKDEENTNLKERILFLEGKLNLFNFSRCDCDMNSP